MTEDKLACVVLAAGKGTRMKSDLPKVLHGIAGWPMVRHVVAACEALSPERLVAVVGPGMEGVARAVAPWPSAVQESQLGTADAVKAALPALAGFEGDVLVVYGDTPLITADTLAAMAEALHGPEDPAMVVLGMRPDDPAQYGRLVLADDGTLDRIVEFADASPEERAIGLCNGGLMAFRSAHLGDLLGAIGNDNAKGEFYLTDAVAAAGARGLACAVVEGSAEEIRGINSRAELAEAERAMQQRLRARAMADGATLIDPDSVYFHMDTVLGRDVVVHPSVIFGPGAVIGDRVEIKGFCHIEGARVAADAQIGPFARLRPGAEIGADAHVGNFVEVKNAVLGDGAKANHLTYLGDADVGAGSNIGAGTITCNYDGFLKHRTVIGEEVFIGSNTALVAPVTIGDRANVGAGSVIAKDVEADALGLERSEQRNVQGWARKYRAAKAAAKRAKSAG